MSTIFLLYSNYLHSDGGEGVPSVTDQGVFDLQTKGKYR